MSKEIEHKYLVRDDSYKAMATHSVAIVQGYISKDPDRVVRLRRADGKCYLTLKGRNDGDTRAEFEYSIPAEDFEGLLKLCQPRTIEKRRWYVPYEGYTWEVDEFFGDHAGLTIAEIELTHSHHDYPLPPFVGTEVTEDPRYYNSNLSSVHSA